MRGEQASRWCHTPHEYLNHNLKRYPNEKEYVETKFRVWIMEVGQEKAEEGVQPSELDGLPSQGLEPVETGQPVQTKRKRERTPWSSVPYLQKILEVGTSMRDPFDLKSATEAFNTALSQSPTFETKSHSVSTFGTPYRRVLDKAKELAGTKLHMAELLQQYDTTEKTYEAMCSDEYWNLERELVRLRKELRLDRSIEDHAKLENTLCKFGIKLKDLSIESNVVKIKNPICNDDRKNGSPPGSSEAGDASDVTVDELDEIDLYPGGE